MRTRLRVGFERTGQCNQAESGAGIAAVLFDLDGVLAQTSVLHQRAWEDLFRSYFAARGIEPGYSSSDYYALIDGRPRFDAVQAMLESRGVQLEWGAPADDESEETVCGLGNRKNRVFEDLLVRCGSIAYPETVEILEWLRAEGIELAVVSSSRNALAVLEAIGVVDAFAAVVDGLVAEGRGLAGKPDPATFCFAAESLGVTPDRAVVVEDATFGVAAGRAGGFRMVIGVDRGAGADALLSAGADLVVESLAELKGLLRGTSEAANA